MCITNVQKGEEMKAIVLRGANQFALEEVEKPKCPEGGLLLKVECVGLCGSDLRKLRFGAHEAPVILGHELVATIVEKGSGVTEFEVGDRVMPAIAATCKECFYCKNKMDSMCEHIKVQALGYTANPDYQGGFAEYMPIVADLVKNGKIIKLPDSMSNDEAVMIEPYTNILNSHDPLPLDEMTNAVIIGAGPVGTMHAELLEARGIKCLVADMNVARLEMVKRVLTPAKLVCSAEESLEDAVKEFTDGRGADLVIVACSSAKAQAQSLGLLRGRGHVVFFGGLPSDNPYTQLDGNLIHYRQLNIHGTYGSNLYHFDMAYEMIVSGKLNAAAYVNHFKLEEFEEVVKMMERGDVLKPVFEL